MFDYSYFAFNLTFNFSIEPVYLLSEELNKQIDNSRVLFVKIPANDIKFLDYWANQLENIQDCPS